MADKNAHPEKSFADGYIDGWRAGARSNNTPSIPAFAIPAGYTAYGIGYERGYVAGKARSGL